MAKTRKRKQPVISCPGCGVEFNTDTLLLQHMKKSPRCQPKIIQCIACRKEFTSEIKLHGHLRHFSQQNCLSLHNEYKNKSHLSSVTDILPQTLEEFTVHQKKPTYSAQERIGRNYLIGVGKDFLSGEIGLEDFCRPKLQKTINQSLEACNPLLQEAQPPASDTINQSPTQEQDSLVNSDTRQIPGDDIDNQRNVSAPDTEFGYYSDSDNDEPDYDDEHRHEDFDEDGDGEMTLCRPINPPLAAPTVQPITVPHQQHRSRFKDFEISSGDLLTRQKKN